MRNLFVLLFLLGLSFTSYSQEEKVYAYNDEELIEKPAPTPEFTKWIKKNNEKIGKSAPHSTKETTKVTLVFLVDKQGDLKKIFIARGIGQGYDEYAHKLFTENPHKWTPGKNSKSEPVVTEVYYRLDYIKNKNKVVNGDNLLIN
ncbi:hypothetical protein [Marinigracilibium pacificum]|uniref:TonB C-terminal domain-containing protein n=1 Tax=Marinigracilibium pacificum TaxID=2729599 RepID=A0A848J0C0_9BACT|nr:hypothetical protein [Marinigracilibium pacificum]NMM47924.1 hypothetical protein [Marinigracilibium pacificum]